MRTTARLLAELAHENCSIVMEHAFSRAPFVQLRQQFEGEWHFLNKMLFEMSEIRADRALLELAVHLRAIDDEEDLKRGLPHGFALGAVHKQDSPDEPLYFRDMTNKVLHAASTEWVIDDPQNAHVICRGRDPERWVAARVNLVQLATLCGMLGS